MKVVSHRLFSIALWWCCLTHLYCSSSGHLQYPREDMLLWKRDKLKFTTSLCWSMDLLSYCGGGIVASLSTSPKLAQMGQQGCTAKLRSHFTSARVIIRGRKKSLNSFLWFPTLWHTGRWAVHPWHSSMIADSSQRADAQRDAVSVKIMLIFCKKHIAVLFVDNLSECWHHAAPPSPSKDTSLSTPVPFDPMEIRNSVLYPGNKFVARWQIQRSWDQRLHATIPHE